MMKITTLAIAFGPALLVLTLKTVIQPSWLIDYSLTVCLIIGAVIGALGGITTLIIEPQN